MILVRIALRNLWLHKFKTFVVGFILFSGTALVVWGNAVLDRLDQTMAMAIVNSVSGHLQVYSADAKDEFTIFRGFDSSTKDIGHITNFSEVRKKLEALEEVSTVVPMGINFAVVFTGNFLDRKLSELRDALDDKDEARSGVVFAHVKRIVAVLDKELKNLEDVSDMTRVMKDAGDSFEALEATRDEAFWARFDKAPYDVLETLENKVAKLAFGEDLIWLNYIGTDTERFQKTFDRFEIVDGEPIPPGKRGFLFNKRIYERFVKNKTARRLDMIKERLDDGMEFGDCDDCKTWVKQNINQAASLTYQLDDQGADALRAALQKELSSQEPDVTLLLQELLDMNSGNFEQRFAVFRAEVAPRIVEYTIRVGDTLVLTAFSRGGYVRKVPVKVYGTFRFRSLDRSPLAGGFNVMDLMTFRDLYGFMTQERLAEIEKIRKSVGVEDVGNADEAEDTLFGEEGEEREEGEALVEVAKSSSYDATEGLDMAAGGERYTREVHQRVYSTEEIEDGIVLNAAVMLHDGVDLEDAQAKVAAAGKSVGVQVINWRTAAGLVGEFIFVIRAVLYAAVFIIFIVALVIINNSLVMSTVERTVEIGTMRAIGAQKGFVRTMIMVETAVLAVIFGGGGALVGSAIVLWMQANGIAAWNDVTYFIFAGPTFNPVLLPKHLIIAMVVIALVSIGSTLYPAILATRVTPREAMASEE